MRSSKIIQIIGLVEATICLGILMYLLVKVEYHEDILYHQSIFNGEVAEFQELQAALNKQDIKHWEAQIDFNNAAAKYIKRDQ
jgi:hypothetical protein